MVGLWNLQLENTVSQEDLANKDNEKLAIGTGTASSWVPVLECSKLASKRSTGKPF